MRALSMKDQLTQTLLKLVTNKDYRFSKKKCVVTGTKLVRDLGQRYRFHELLTSREEDPALEGLKAESIHIASPHVLRHLAELHDFDGIVGTLDMPVQRQEKDLSAPRLILALDYVEDPGLLGTLLRTAVAFQWQAVYLLNNCADPFESRAMRASQGALFNIPHCRGRLEDLLKFCQRRKLPLCVSHPTGSDIGSSSWEPPPNGMVLLLREEYAAPWAPPKTALRVAVPDPWRSQPRGPPDGQTFEPRALDVAVQGGILMHHLKHYHYPRVSRSPFLASPT